MGEQLSDQKVLEELYDLFELPKRRPLSVDAIRAAFRDMREPLYMLYSGSEYTGMSGVKRAAKNVVEHLRSEREYHKKLVMERNALNKRIDELLAENAALRRHELAPSDTVNAAHGE